RRERGRGSSRRATRGLRSAGGPTDAGRSFDTSQGESLTERGGGSETRAAQVIQGGSGRGMGGLPIAGVQPAFHCDNERTGVGTGANALKERGDLVGGGGFRAGLAAEVAEQEKLQPGAIVDREIAACRGGDGGPQFLFDRWGRCGGWG